jgi:adenine-specific DNA-methyltransferase
VFDPTCGSGTTAMVAEQWGRRWITCDTSPVATFLARQRLITSVFPSYLLQSPQEGVKGGFQYRSVPHVKLKNLAFDEALQHELLYDDPLIDPTKMRVPGLVNFESFTGEPDLPDDLIANMLLNLQNSGISLPGREIIPLNNLEICKQGVITVTGNLSREHAQKKIALCFNSPYSPLTLGGISDAKAEAGDTFDIISFMGFHFLPEVQTRIFSERDHHPRLTLVSVNFEILLKDLLPAVKGTQLFTMMGHPVMEIKFTTEKNKAFINLQGIQVFNPKTSQYYTIPPKHIAAWFLDEDYDGHAFYIHQCAFLGRKNPWQKAQRGLRGILEDEDFQILSGTQSRPFTCYQGQKIALKVFDFQGNDVSIIITIGE